MLDKNKFNKAYKKVDNVGAFYREVGFSKEAREFWGKKNKGKYDKLKF